MSTPFYPRSAAEPQSKIETTKNNKKEGPRKTRRNTEREERFLNHRGHSAAEPQPKCLNFEEVNHKDTKARRETLDL
uniref:Uncharacterized protein n=1 Tax=Candidatus Kentrum sp. FM TaxID=2126340 RepID=A0A450T3H1_9GAMM|nr:MAG: hypothetical protein BECKFM1743A_GA0114220_102786 [Candidatus Kentron sp. FM]